MPILLSVVMLSVGSLQISPRFFISGRDGTGDVFNLVTVVAIVAVVVDKERIFLLE
jgi:hypothetical protein